MRRSSSSRRSKARGRSTPSSTPTSSPTARRWPRCAAGCSTPSTPGASSSRGRRRAPAPWPRRTASWRASTRRPSPRWRARRCSAPRSPWRSALPDPETLEARVTTLRERYGEVALHRPRGLQHALFIEHLPRPDGGAVPDYRRQMTAEQVAAMVPVATAAVGSEGGVYLGFDPVAGQAGPLRPDRGAARLAALGRPPHRHPRLGQDDRRPGDRPRGAPAGEPRDRLRPEARPPARRPARAPGRGRAAWSSRPTLRTGASSTRWRSACPSCARSSPPPTCWSCCATRRPPGRWRSTGRCATRCAPGEERLALGGRAAAGGRGPRCP